MFGIGLPEMILILALALIVVGPDKLPDLARSVAKGLMELKKTAEGLKDTMAAEGNPLDELKPDLEEAAKTLKDNLLETPPYLRDEEIPQGGVNPPSENVMAAYDEVMKQSGLDQEATVEAKFTGADEPAPQTQTPSTENQTDEQSQDNPQQSATK